MLNFSVFFNFVILTIAIASHAETGVTDTEIVIGQSAAFSGPSSAKAIIASKGADIYLKRINDQGGVYGRKVRIIALDDGYEPQATIKNTKRLIEQEKVFAVMHYFGTPTMRAALPMLKSNGIPVMTPLGGSEITRNPFLRNVFVIRAGYSKEADLAIDFAIQRNKKKFAIIYQDDGYGTDALSGTLKALAKYNIKPVTTAPYRRNTKDMEIAVKKVNDAAPDFIYVFAIGDSGIDFVERFAKSKWASPPMVMLGSPLVSNEIAKAVDQYKLTVYATSGLPLPDPSVLVAAKSFKRDAMDPVISSDLSGFEGYIDAAVLVEALKRAGKSLTRGTFISALESMSPFDFEGLNISFSPTNHQGMNSAHILICKNGKFETIK